MTSISITQFSDEIDDRRLKRALHGVEDGAIGQPDLVALVRAASVGHGYIRLSVPRTEHWPSVDDWLRASFEVEIAEDTLTVIPQTWLPKWSQSLISPDSDAARKVPRQVSQEVPGDPFLMDSSGGNFNYRTPGQREAVRAVLGSAPGATVLAVLPTGSGKTTVLAAPAFLARKHGVSLIVVPTVALALDLERRFQSDFGIMEPLAYHGGMTAIEKAAFRNSIEEDEQWLIITSPEAALLSLSTVLERLAKRGRIAYLCIDEAHIVASWGGAFRPEFQGLAGFRRSLLALSQSANSNFVTVLLTGTLDQGGLVTLKHLFSEDSLNLVNAQTTRPEPSYWSVPCVDDDEKKKTLLEAVARLPRPLLVYTSLVNSESAVNAVQVFGWLKEAGFKRVRLVTGESSTENRQEVLNGVRCMGPPSSDVDVVVASSAFGLGVDIEDVRAVVHVCIPESLDRLYQEVGRSGRDGKASVSLIIHNSTDEQVARGLAASSDIGPEKAWKRWEAMRKGGQQRPGGLTVSLTAAWEGVEHASSSANRKWNLHTLATMDRAGMIRLHFKPRAAPPSETTDEGLHQFLERQSHLFEIDVVQDDLGDEVRFKERYDRARSEAESSASDSLATVIEMLKSPSKCFNQRFAERYRLYISNGDIVDVDVQCGGCPYCRLNGSPPVSSGLVSPPYVFSPAMKRAAGNQSLFDGARSCSITFNETQSLHWNTLRNILGRLVKNGTRLLVVGRPFPRIGSLQSDSRDDWIAVEDLNSWLSRHKFLDLPTVVILEPGTTQDVVERVLDQSSKQAGIIVIHNFNQSGPAGSPILLRELMPRSFSIHTALGKV